MNFLYRLIRHRKLIAFCLNAMAEMLDEGLVEYYLIYYMNIKDFDVDWEATKTYKNTMEGLAKDLLRGQDVY